MTSPPLTSYSRPTSTSATSSNASNHSTSNSSSLQYSVTSNNTTSEQRTGMKNSSSGVEQRKAAPPVVSAAAAATTTTSQTSSRRNILPKLPEHRPVVANRGGGAGNRAPQYAPAAVPLGPPGAEILAAKPPPGGLVVHQPALTNANKNRPPPLYQNLSRSRSNSNDSDGGGAGGADGTAISSEDDEANGLAYFKSSWRRKNTSTLRRVQRVSRHAALTTKQHFWDSNKVSIDAALSAVDQWEALYNTLRQLLVATMHSARGVYGAAKEGAGQLQHGLLAPLRDWVLLPAFTGLERAVTETQLFLQSNEAQRLAINVLRLAQQVPLIGDNFLAPSLQWSVIFCERVWEIAQYPIPSKQQVRDSVDFALTATKWFLSTFGREVYLYMKRADANLTRTLSHTQWKVLGSGPYETLDFESKKDVMDHLCERYFSLAHSAVARYELAAHIRAKNRPLYHDLVLTGVLRQRGGEITLDDEWLSPLPQYRALDDPFFIGNNTTNTTDTTPTTPIMQQQQQGKLQQKQQPSKETTKLQKQQQHYKKSDSSAMKDDDGETKSDLSTLSSDSLQSDAASTSSAASEGGSSSSLAAAVKFSGDKGNYPLWFRLPNINGKRPSRDAPWICFTRPEQKVLEARYLQILQEQGQGAHLCEQKDAIDGGGVAVGLMTSQEEKEQYHYPQQQSAIHETTDASTTTTNSNSNSNSSERAAAAAADINKDSNSQQKQEQQTRLATLPEAAVLAAAAKSEEDRGAKKFISDLRKTVSVDGDDTSINTEEFDARFGELPGKHETISKWYIHDPATDVLVDQRRQAVSFYICCPKCRAPHTTTLPPVKPKRFGEMCDRCANDKDGGDTGIIPTRVSNLITPPPLTMVMRPLLWRFHGPGDQVRRGTWFLESGRIGLQPFDDEAATILEDAYLFLKWMSIRQAFQDDSEMDGALLTVEVPCPDGTDRLVQFSSLTRATAIQKGITSSVALFKRKVYRGAWLFTEPAPEGKAAAAQSSEEPRMGSLDNLNYIPDDTRLSPHPSQHNRQQQQQQIPQQRHMTVEEKIIKAVKSSGSLGNTIVPDMSIRQVLSNQPPPRDETRVVVYTKKRDLNASIAATPELLEKTMGKQLDDAKEGKVEHLVLIVHGIGEMLRTIDLFGLAIPNLSSIIECCAFLRKNHSEVHDAHFKELFPSADAASRASTGRVEYLPVEWHEAFSLLSQRRAPGSNEQGRRSTMIKDISLQTIPNMREFANDTLMDVLYFMSPEHHDIIIDVVIREMNLVVDKFRDLHGTEFQGRISVIGHSLGSIIAWDILCNQNPESVASSNRDLRASPPRSPDIKASPTRTPSSRRERRNNESPDSASFFFSPAGRTQGSTPSREALEWATNPSSPAQLFSTYPQLDFTVDNFFMLGSPVAVFLMIRNQRKPLTEDYSLKGCKRCFNIFHPYDPVAYRLEPCIHPRNADFEPTIMKHWNGGFRVHYHTKRLWRKLVESTLKTQQNVVEAFEASMAGMGLIDTTTATEEEERAELNFSMEARANRVITGRLNQGRRIDYMLQEKEIENANEYVAALAAHSSYWIEKDLSLFISRQIYLSTMESGGSKPEVDHEAWEKL